MQQPFEQFVRALRAADVPVSVAEVIDATEVIAAIGYEDRQLLKDALGLTVAKSEEEKERFDTAFELFYARTEFQDTFEAWSDPDQQDGDAGPDDTQEECAPGGGEGGVAGQGSDGDPGQSALADMILAGDGEGLASAMEAAATDVGAADIKVFTQRGYLARQMLDQMGMRDLERLILSLEQQPLEQEDEAEGNSKRAALTQGRQQLFEEARNYMERQFELYARAAGQQFREEFLESTVMSNIPPRDFHIMSRIVRRMAKKLASKYMRCHRRARRGHLDVRRTLRRNMAHDGIPFETVWKHQKISKPNVVAICDVSGSVAATARFLLLFLYSLNEVISKLESFAFSSHLERISDDLEDHDVEEAIPVILKKIGFRSTDYGQMLRDFRDDHLDLLERGATVIMLGDGRTNDADPGVDIMKQIYERSRRVIWLNPEPESFWGTGDSEMPRYRPYCHVAKTCSTLKQLERVIDDLLRSSVRV